MSAFQTIYVLDTDIEFEGVCELCLKAEESLYAPKSDPTVTGTLGRFVDLTFRSCRRGHRICIKRSRALEKRRAA
jgi:hypothetical protein